MRARAFGECLEPAWVSTHQADRSAGSTWHAPQAPAGPRRPVRPSGHDRGRRPRAPWRRQHPRVRRKEVQGSRQGPQAFGKEGQALRKGRCGRREGIVPDTARSARVVPGSARRAQGSARKKALPLPARDARMDRRVRTRRRRPAGGRAGGTGRARCAAFVPDHPGRAAPAAFAAGIRSPRHPGGSCGSVACRLAAPLGPRRLYFPAAVRWSASRQGPCRAQVHFTQARAGAGVAVAGMAGSGSTPLPGSQWRSAGVVTTVLASAMMTSIVNSVGEITPRS